MNAIEIIVSLIEMLIAGIGVGYLFGLLSHSRWKRERREAAQQQQEDEALRLANQRGHGI